MCLRFSDSFLSITVVIYLARDILPTVIKEGEISTLRPAFHERNFVSLNALAF